MYHDGTLHLADRLGQFERLLREFDRIELGHAIDLAIARLDAEDGDPDFETTDLEDDFLLSARALASVTGPGCPVADVGGGNIEDQGEAGSWAETEGYQPSGGHVYGDDDREPEDVSLRAFHRRYIRATRCDRYTRYGRTTYHLRDESGRGFIQMVL